MKWQFRSAADVERFWKRVQHVPARVDGRTKSQEEHYCLALYLLALSRNGLLSFPISASRQESPDFMLTDASCRTTGLEVTRATEGWLQQAMTAAERRYSALDRHAKSHNGSAVATISLRHSRGWLAGEAESEWCKMMLLAIDAKVARLPKFETAAAHDLLIADDTPLPAIDRKLAFERLNATLRKGAGKGFRTISAIVSLDIGYDLGRRPRLFSYVDWNQPKLGTGRDRVEFGRAAELAGQAAVDRALSPVYSVDETGRIEKETFDGRIFEIEIDSRGTERIIRQIRPE